jgi:prepilin peptidase CpaA
MLEHATTIVLLSLLGAAVWTDQRSHRIPNVLVLAVLVSGLVLQGVAGGLSGIGIALAGVATGFGVFLIPYLMKGMAAGDVKLLAAIGAYLGPLPVLLAGGIATIAAASIAGSLIAYQRYQGASMTVEQMLTHRFPFAAAIAIGVGCVLILKGTL